MEEIFVILDELKYDHDVILLLSVISPSSYRVLYSVAKGWDDPPHPTFTLENGITGPPLNRNVNLELRKAIFYDEALLATCNLKTTRFSCFIATCLQAESHGRHIRRAPIGMKRAFWNLRSDPQKTGQLDIAYDVLAMMRDSTPAIRVCLAGEKVEYSDNDKHWYAVPKQTNECQQPRSKEPKVKVSQAKKREDTRKRVARCRASKRADKNSYRTISGLHSNEEFQRELQSRSNSINASKLQNKGNDQSSQSRKPTKLVSIPSSAKSHC
jgi:hypothetical protein